MTAINRNVVVPEGYMKDRKGRLVPVSQVSAYDLEMDALCAPVWLRQRRKVR